LLGLLFALLTVTIRADHVVAGLALVLFGDGLSSFAGHGLVAIDVPQSVHALPIPLLSDIPALGPIFFRQNALVYLSYFMVAAVWYFLYRTGPGLALRAAGEKPSAVDVVGWNVFRIRYLAVVFGAGMAGLAGAFLSRNSQETSRRLEHCFALFPRLFCRAMLPLSGKTLTYVSGIIPVIWAWWGGGRSGGACWYRSRSWCRSCRW